MSTHSDGPGAARHLAAAVIGAGQAGLSAAYYLAVRGVEPWQEFVVFDANDGPGGAWRHRWDSLTFGRAHRIHPLPGAPLDVTDGTTPANRVVPSYYGDYEREFSLPVLRPAAVARVEHDGTHFVLTTARGTYTADMVINATGTWDSPHLPYYPGLLDFAGTQLHTRDYTRAEDFAGERVLVVGGGTSALQFIQELDASGVETVWASRRAPQWVTEPFDENWGIAVENAVNERTQRGLPPLSVSAVTGIGLHGTYRDDVAAGLLISRGRPVRLRRGSVVLDGPGPDGGHIPTQGRADAVITEATRRAVPALPGRATVDGYWEVPIDTILWATGFRPHLTHLRDLGIREAGGGILMHTDGVTVLKQPGLFMAGYGASASTLGATRAGRRAAMKVVRALEDQVLTA